MKSGRPDVPVATMTAPRIVKVRVWATSPVALVVEQGAANPRLQLLDNALRAALGGETLAYFEGWLPTLESDWIIGKKVEAQPW
jgi:hypothetical protein